MRGVQTAKVEACARVQVQWAGRAIDVTDVSAGTRGHGHLEAPVRLKARARRVMRSTRAHARARARRNLRTPFGGFEKGTGAGIL